MSLATRCTACGTIFRVVPDQLRVSEGWVRCGRCAEVFDAREQLFDIDRDAPPPWPAPAADVDLQVDADVGSEAIAEPEQAATRPADESTWIVPRSETSTAADEEPAIDFEPSSPAPLPADSRREPYWDEAPEANSADAGREPVESEVTVAIASTSTALRKETEETAVSAAMDDTAATPDAESAVAAEQPVAGFLRQAQSRSKWQRPGVRLALGASTLALSLLLAAQLVWQFRDALNAVLPQSAPALHAFCSVAGCELQPWRRIDALTVENSGLTVAGNGNNYKLRVNLHNRAAYALALPWVDLTLTDANGAVLLRRMLGPNDFSLGAAQSIAGHGEQTLQLLFNTGSLRVAGYSIEIFHP